MADEKTIETAASNQVEGAARTVAVIDGNSLMHRAYHAVPPTMNAPDGTPTNAVFGFLSMLLKFYELYQPSAIICAFDAGKPSHRIAAMEQYKAQRPPMDQELRVQFPLMEELLESMSIPVVKVPGWEGDDILGTIAARDEALGYRTLLVTGDNVVKEAGKLPFKNTVYREYGKIGREGYVEMYLEDGTQLISQGTQFELAGDFSLDLPQKSMKFRAKSLYGAKTFEAQLFEDRPYTEYKSFVLRNSGNDGAWTRMVDGVQSRLMDMYGTQVIHQAWRPVAVYLNGIYWGHFNLRERVDRFFVAQHEGIPLDQADDMDILRASGSVEWGSNKAYKAMVAKMDELGFGNCTNTRACEAVCPKNDSIANIARLNREFIKAKLAD